LYRIAVIALLFALSLGGCGFQMQGTFAVPDGMQRTYIEADDKFSPFYRTLKRDLQASGVNVVDSIDTATAVLTIYQDQTDQRVLSVSARNVPTEFEVFYIVRYGLISGENTLLEVQDLSATRSYTYDPALVLGKAAEQEIMRNAIVDDLVRILLKQISVR
jgi:LPS-assembly lipoprotein